MTAATATPATPGVRQHNLAMVLGAIPPRTPVSRAALSATTGLTKATVSSIVADLQSLGLVEEAPPGEGAESTRSRTIAAGRPPKPIRHRRGGVVGIGAQIEPGELRLASTDLTGHVSHVPPLTIDTSLGEDPRHLATVVAHHLAILIDRTRSDGGRAVGVGIAVPGLVDSDRTTVLVAPPLGWRAVDLGAHVATELNRIVAGREPIPVTLANEADDAALAEHQRGVGADTDVQSMLYLSVGSGVGAGIVVDGAVFRGAHGFGGELGHITVTPDGVRCSCGKHGCLETIVGAEALRRDPPAASSAAMTRVADALASVLSSAVDLFDPEMVVLGGDLQPLAGAVAPVIERAIRQRVLGASWVDYLVVGGRLGREAAVTGAADRSLNALRRDPLGVLGARAGATGTP